MMPDNSVLRSFASAILVRALAGKRDRNPAHTRLHTKENRGLRKLGKMSGVDKGHLWIEDSAMWSGLSPTLNHFSLFVSCLHFFFFLPQIEIFGMGWRVGERGEARLQTSQLNLLQLVALEERDLAVYKSQGKVLISCLRPHAHIWDQHHIQARLGQQGTAIGSQIEFYRNRSGGKSG